MTWIERPLEVIAALTENRAPSEWKAVINTYFEDKLTDEHLLGDIPSLNDRPLEDVKSNSLVRFRCMIQDMLNPELYMEVVASRGGGESSAVEMLCGMYVDGVCPPQPDGELLLDSPRNIIRERQVFYCVPVPAENTWVKKAYAGDAVKNRRECVGSSDVTISVPDLNRPGCFVKVYDDSVSYSLKAVVEFVGIFSNDPAGFGSLRGDDDDDDDERMHLSAVEMRDVSVDAMRELSVDVQSPPRLHAIAGFPLKHSNPLLCRTVLQDREYVEQFLSRCGEIRSRLLSFLEGIVFGDRLAASYLLCHLLSHVYMHRDVDALGKFCLNLTNIKKEDGFCRPFYKIMELLTTKSHFLPLTIANLNDGTYAPFKNYRRNRVETAVLQLSSDTHLVIDETSFSTGFLDSKGVKNIKALGKLIDSQTVDYDFTYHQLAFRTDVPVLILSEGKSVLPSDCTCPIVRSESWNGCDAISKASESVGDVIEDVRRYVSLLKMLDYGIPDEMQTVIQEYFVEQRQDRGQAMKAEDLHGLIVISRLISLSFGHTSLGRSSWDAAKEMESERRARMERRR